MVEFPPRHILQICRAYIAITMALVTSMLAEIFCAISTSVVEAQIVLPPHDRFTDSRLRLAHRKELQRHDNLRPYIGGYKSNPSDCY